MILALVISRTKTVTGQSYTKDHGPGFPPILLVSLWDVVTTVISMSKNVQVAELDNR